MAAKRNVTIILGAERQYHRDVWLGVARYHRLHCSWNLHGEPSVEGFRLMLRALPRSDGLIAMLNSRSLLDYLRSQRVPFISLSYSFDEDEEICRVVNDGPLVASLALEHFRERGFRHFAYCELDNGSYLRGRYFVAAIERSGCDCSVFRVGYRDRRRWIGGRDRPALGDWIASLPKPVGIFAHNDIRGRHLIEVCDERGVQVPDEVAILGFDNELPHCEMCDPPLSSMVPNAERVGFEAAALLDRLMDGQGPQCRRILVPPCGIITRQSTDVIATSDPLVAKAMHFIRRHACDGIDVSDVLTHVVVSRTWLDQQFRAALGRTPHEEIVRLRLHHTRELLAETDYSVEVIAERVGFRHASYLGVVFLKEFGRTPGQYRAEHRKDP